PRRLRNRIRHVLRRLGAADLWNDPVHLQRLHALRYLPRGDRRAAPPAARTLRTRRTGIRGAGMKRAGWLTELLGAIALGVLLAVASSLWVASGDQIKFQKAIVYVALVTALYVFVGNSGVISFGQVSFVAVGAFASGVMTIPLDTKRGVLPTLFPLL